MTTHFRGVGDGQGGLACCGSWSLKELDKTEHLSLSISCLVYRLFDDGHSDQCKVIPHCSFDLHFSSNE